MFKILASVLITLLVLVGVYYFVPIGFLENPISLNAPIGSTITTIQGSDTLSASRTVINNNFSALNNGKIEYSSSSIAAITTLSNLSSIGTITTGTWNATAISVLKGGTGTTSPSSYLVLLGNGAAGLTIASSTGTLGQSLVSNGPGAYPTWQSVGIDQTDNYTWTGTHIFNTNFTTFGAGFVSQASSTISGLLTVTSNLAVGGTATSTFLNISASNNATTTNLWVSGTCLGCAKTFIKSAICTLDGGTPSVCSAAVTCPTGYVVTGGGFGTNPGASCDTGGEVGWQTSYPSATTTWTVGAICANSASGSFTGYAVCVRNE